MEKSSGDCGSELVGVDTASDNDDHARSIRTIVPHELESVEEDDGDQMARQEQRRQRDEEEDEERRSRRAELPRPGIPESNLVGNHSVINQLFECLNTITDQLQSVVEFATSAKHDLNSPIVEPTLPPPTPDTATNPPPPRNHTKVFHADSNHPWQRQKRTSSSGTRRGAG